MKPKPIGRLLGIGVRVAAQRVRQQIGGMSSGTAAPASPHTGQVPAPGPPRRLVDPQKARNLGRASKKFGEAVWGPFLHLGGVLWLEITGLFFVLFTLFFAQNVYRLRYAWHAGADHQRFLLYCRVYAGLSLFRREFLLSRAPQGTKPKSVRKAWLHAAKASQFGTANGLPANPVGESKTHYTLEGSERRPALTPSTLLDFPASFPLPAAYSPPCTAAACGPCASTPAWAMPKRAIAATNSCWPTALPASPSPSTCPPRSAMTPTTRCRSAKSARSAWPSIPLKTWSGSSMAFHSTRSPPR